MKVGKAYVTGMGVVSCLGSGVGAFWQALCEGRSGLGPLTRFELEGSPYGTAGQVNGFPAQPYEQCGLSLGGQFAAEAAAQALAGCHTELITSAALIVATNFGPAEVFEAQLGAPPPSCSSSFRLADGLFAEEAQRIARRIGAGGPVATISLSCASGNAAIACALDLVRTGRAEAALACGYDSIQRMSWAGLSCLRVMALSDGDGPARLRPFDVRRAGTLFSEGAGCLLIESAEFARRRGATALAEVAGAGANNNAYHLTHADKEGRGTACVLRMALEDAGMTPEHVDHFNAHGTGTRLNDVVETRALHAVFGPRAARIPVCSNKGGLGHGMGAASSLEAVGAVMSLREGKIPPTLNLEELDPECELNVVRGTVLEGEIRSVLSNSAGIGGANAAVVFCRADGDRVEPAGEQ